MLWLVLVATAASVLQEVTSLRHFADAPIEGPSPLYSLDGGDWTATNSRLNVRPCLSRTLRQRCLQALFLFLFSP